MFEMCILGENSVMVIFFLVIVTLISMVVDIQTYIAVIKIHKHSLCKKASNHHANLPLEMYSFTL